MVGDWGIDGDGCWSILFWLSLSTFLIDGRWCGMRLLDFGFWILDLRFCTGRPLLLFLGSGLQALKGRKEGMHSLIEPTLEPNFS